MRLEIFVVALFGWGHACGQVVEVPAQRGEQHSAWQSVLIGAGNKSGRAITTAANGNALILDFDPSQNCGIPVVKVIVNLEREVERPTVERVVGSFRIDQQDPIAFSGEYSLGLGDRFGWLAVDAVSSPRIFVAQLISGNNVRIQLGDATSQRVERWSLNGATAAMYRATQLCKAL